MLRARWYHLVLMFLLVPRLSSAIQLTWSGGVSDLTFTSAVRCTLFVQAGSAETRLPSEWRLMWVADSSGVNLVATDSLAVCLTDTAQVSTIDPPSTPADSAANQFTAHFCSGGSAQAVVAYFLFDQPGGSHGRIRVVALDPADPDSSHVIESNEVTYNGGVEGSYAPVILHASGVHQSLQLQVTAVGSGLLAANSLSIVASDSSWSLPLSITARSNGAVTATASVAALLPACRVGIGSEDGAVSAAFLPADEEPADFDPQSGGCSAQFFEELLLPPPSQHGYTIQPKDFAFARGFVDHSSSRYALHLFYTRHNYWYYPPPPAVQHPELDEKNFGHTWTTDFNSWHPNPTDTTAVKVRAGKFDELHVWAPTIVPNGPIFYMFYTGIRSEGGRQNQRIGVASSTDLNTWTQRDTAVLTSPDILWASKNPLAYGAQQLRDPFVMEDPVNSGQWLMYFVAVDSLRAPKMAVGAAKSTDLVHWTAFAKPFSSTERPTVPPSNVVESPHVFRRNGQWWMPYTVGQDQVFFETSTSADPADTVAANWTSPVWLRQVSQGRPAELQFWHASEHLKVASGYEYLAAFDDNATSIDIKGVFATDSAGVDSFLLSCPQTLGVADRDGSGDGVRMAVSRLRWSAPEVDLRIELPSRMPVRLAVHDIAGRRCSTILDGELPGGATEVTWDGRDGGGRRVASGMYFIRLTYNKGARVSKIVMLR